MKYKIKISPEANKEIDDALRYYGKINPKLSIELFNLIFDNLRYIQENPLSFSNRYKNIRISVLEKFPYIISYFIDESNSSIIIIAVFNTHQNPKKWKSRIKY